MVPAVDSKNKKQPIISIPSSPELKSSSIDDENEESQEEDDGEVSEDEYVDDTDRDWEDSRFSLLLLSINLMKRFDDRQCFWFQFC